jgi:hypothetical protein
MSDGHEAATDAERLTEAADQVTHSTASLVEQITGLREDFRADREQAAAGLQEAREQAAADVAAERRDRRLATWKFGIVVLVDVVLSAVSVGLYVNLRDTEATLHQTQTAVLCPLYRLLAQAALTPQVGETDQQRAARISAQGPILTGYTKLGCSPPLPPSTPPR